MKLTIMLFMFLIIIIGQLNSQNTNTLLLSQINGVRYQCLISNCSSPMIMFGTNSKACQIACLINKNCRIITFDQVNNQCELFVDTPSQYGSLIAHENFVTFISGDNRQLSARK